MAGVSKGNKVELQTFIGWGKGTIIGHKTEVTPDGKCYVNFIWCKVCAHYKERLLSSLKGSTKTAALSFINGTNVVTKYQVYIYIYIICINFFLRLTSTLYKIIFIKCR